MSTFDGLTLSDYAVSSGFSHSPSSTDFAASYSTIFFTMRDKLESHTDSVLGDGLHTALRGGLGVNSKHSPLHTKTIQLLKTDSETLESAFSANQGYSTAINTIRTAELKHAKQDAEITLNSAVLPQSVGLKDRGLTTTIDALTDQNTWEAAESVLERASDITLQQDAQSTTASEALLNRTHKSTMSADANAWELSEVELDNTNNEAMLMAQLRLDFLKALIGQVANRYVTGRQYISTDPGSNQTYGFNVAPVSPSYMLANRFPLLWGADTNLSMPDYYQWVPLGPSTNDGKIEDELYRTQTVGYTITSQGGYVYFKAITQDVYLQKELWTKSDDI